MHNMCQMLAVKGMELLYFYNGETIRYLLQNMCQILAAKGKEELYLYNGETCIIRCECNLMAMLDGMLD